MAGGNVPRPSHLQLVRNGVVLAVLRFEHQADGDLVIDKLKQRRQRAVLVSDLECEQLCDIPIQIHANIMARILPHPDYLLARGHAGFWIGYKFRSGKGFGRERYSRDPRTAESCKVWIVRILELFAKQI